MSEFWWLQPGWKKTLCAHCGCNIWDSGGDPDHGLCWRCWNDEWERTHPVKKDTKRRKP